MCFIGEGEQTSIAPIRVTAKYTPTFMNFGQLQDGRPKKRTTKPLTGMKRFAKAGKKITQLIKEKKKI